MKAFLREQEEKARTDVSGSESEADSEAAAKRPAAKRPAAHETRDRAKTRAFERAIKNDEIPDDDVKLYRSSSRAKQTDIINNAISKVGETFTIDLQHPAFVERRKLLKTNSRGRTEEGVILEVARAQCGNSQAALDTAGTRPGSPPIFSCISYMVVASTVVGDGWLIQEWPLS